MKDLIPFPATKSFRLVGIVHKVYCTPDYTELTVSHILDDWENKRIERYKVYSRGKTKMFVDRSVQEGNSVDIIGTLSSSGKSGKEPQVYLNAMHVTVYKVSTGEKIQMTEAQYINLDEIELDNNAF
jgi:hypothetical protein